MQEDIYKVQIDDIFEGPMDLLVHLIKKHEMDIYDIPIALITKQYLEYIEWLKIMDIDIAGDFIVMASTLTKIKSRMLLPSHEEDEEDPRLELVKPIEEYLRMKSAGLVSAGHASEHGASWQSRQRSASAIAWVRSSPLLICLNFSALLTTIPPSEFR